MKLEVLAEGIETQKQQEFLLKHNCNLSQGYLDSKPIPKKSLRAFYYLLLKELNFFSFSLSVLYWNEKF